MLLLSVQKHLSVLIGLVFLKFCLTGFMTGKKFLSLVQEITDISFGFIPLPGVVKDKITAFIGEKIDTLMVQLTEAEVGGEGIDLEFKDIKVQAEEMAVTLLIKPRE